MEYVAAIAPSEIMDTIDIKISSKDKWTASERFSILE